MENRNLPLPPEQQMTYGQWLDRLAELCDDPNADTDDIIELAREIAKDEGLRQAAASYWNEPR